MVHTAETTRVRYFMDLLMEQRRPVMLVGNAGTGKSVMMRDKLAALSTDDYFVQFVPFNFYTTSAMLQGKAGPGCAPGAAPRPPALPTRPSRRSRPGEAPGEEIGAELRPARRPEAHLLCRRHEHAGGGQVRHRGTAHTHPAAHGPRALVGARPVAPAAGAR